MKLLKKINVLAITFFGLASYAQELDVNLQLRPRFEYRNGFKELMKEGSFPNSFVSQRSRLSLNYKQDRLKAKLSFQNVRNWGDVTTVATSDKNGMALFEAWALYELDPSWSVKVGRQPISYDNQRIMGEIDWAQQAQTYDAALLTYNTKKHHVDLGFAVNTDGEKLYKELYTTNFKNMQYVWYHTTISKLGMSLLFSNMGYQYKLPSTNDLKIDYLQTFGTYLNFKDKKFDANLGVYGQTGEGKLTTESTPVSAYYIGFLANYDVTAQFKTSFGYDYLSGKDQGDTSNKIKSFFPSSGTNHAFNGLMDYFYVGSFKNSVGLKDIYFKFNVLAKKWQFNLSPHFFTTANTVLNPTVTTKKMDRYLGTEVDLVTTFAYKKDITLSAGYSQMFGTNTLEVLKGGNKDNDNNWAWIMININPRIFSATIK